MFKISFLLLLCLSPTLLIAEQLNVAVASNFVLPMRAIAKKFESDTQHQITIISGSSGKHYAQINHGAPFDIFFSADAQRPALLEKSGLGISESRATYAIGRLALWTMDQILVDGNTLKSHSSEIRHLSIANPKIAPYGIAAREALQSMKVWEQYQARLVLGENISQTHSFVASENAKFGFVAWSQLKSPGKTASGSYWLVPDHLHQPIEQQFILLKQSQAASALLQFILSDPGRTIIRSYGYDLP